MDAKLTPLTAPPGDPEGAAPSRRRWALGPVGRKCTLVFLGVLMGCAAVAVLAGVLAKVAGDRRSGGGQAAPAQAPAPAPAPAQPDAAAAGGAASAAAVAAEGPDAKLAFYDENQGLQQVYMQLEPSSLAVQGQDGSMPFVFEGPGPCRQLLQFSNISLDLSAAATGCRGAAACAINLRVALPKPGTCAEFPGPATTVYLVPGFSCTPAMYRTWIERLASWGYAVVTYDRPLGGALQPPAEQELAYFDSILAWQRAANNTQRLGGRLNGLFSAGQLGVVGHSMGGGLAAILAGQHPRDVGALVLLDPVDYTQLSLKVARRYLAQYRQPVLLMTVGIHCMDRNGCVPPQDHVPSAAEEAAWAAAGQCRPDWWCCDWDDNTPGLEVKTAAGIGLPTDGPSGFAEVAPTGSWMARWGLAGHTSFLEPGSLVFGGTTCPAALDNGFIIVDSIALTAAFFETRLRGQPGPQEHALAWAARRPAAHLQLGLKGAPAAAW